MTCFICLPPFKALFLSHGSSTLCSISHTRRKEPLANQYSSSTDFAPYSTVLSSKKMDSTMRRSWAHHPPCLERTFCASILARILYCIAGKGWYCIGRIWAVPALKEQTWSIARHRLLKVYQVMHFSKTNCLNCQVDSSLSMFSIPSHVPVGAHMVLLTVYSSSTLTWGSKEPRDQSRSFGSDHYLFLSPTVRLAHAGFSAT
jgi:hypothetical protein